MVGDKENESLGVQPSDTAYSIQDFVNECSIGAHGHAMTTAPDRPIVHRAEPDPTGRRRLFKAAAVGGVAATAGMATAGSARADTLPVGPAEFTTVQVDSSLTISDYTAGDGDQTMLQAGGVIIKQVTIDGHLEQPRLTFDDRGAVLVGQVLTGDEGWDRVGIQPALTATATSPEVALVAEQSPGHRALDPVTGQRRVPLRGGAAITASSPNAAVVATQTDSRYEGTAVQGTSAGGYGGLFAGSRAPVHLVPGRVTHPSSGETGDLYVTARGDLWFCKGGRAWRKIA